MFSRCIACLILISFCMSGSPNTADGIVVAKASKLSRLGIFSWNKRDANDPALRHEMLETLVRLGINEIYQNMDDEASPAFMEEAYARGIDVYLLAGQPEWGLDRNAEQMRRQVRRAARMMAVNGGPGLAGLVLDVEPYLTSSYKKNPQRAMDRFSEAMRNTYAYAQERGLHLIICIPYFYDSKGFVAELKSLIEEGSDAVAVMNYQKKDEAGQIKEETMLSLQADKGLIHIFELQQPGTHDLTERNTYYLDGLQAVWDSRDKLLNHYEYEKLSFALHDYTALREMINNE